MFKKLGIAALLTASFGMALAPATAYAQDGYYGRGGGGYYDGHRDRDRDWDRHERHEWHERQERRAEEWRERQWRAHEWREHEGYYYRPYNNYYYSPYQQYQPGTSFYFGYGR